MGFGIRVDMRFRMDGMLGPGPAGSKRLRRTTAWGRDPALMVAATIVAEALGKAYPCAR